MESTNNNDLTAVSCSTCKHNDNTKPAPPICWSCVGNRSTKPGGNKYPMHSPVNPTAVVDKPLDVGRKDDAGKPNWTLLPWKQLRTVVDVLTIGAKKYGDHNWKLVAYSRYECALMRHVAAVQSGEWLDAETHLPHLAHVVCNALYLMWHKEHIDDA
jgi:hypothetical protein